MIQGSRMGKRSVTLPVKKKLMTIEIFTIIDYTIFNKPVVYKIIVLTIIINIINSIIIIIIINYIIIVINLFGSLRFLIESKSTSDNEKTEEAMENILFTFTHIMEGVRF